MHDRSSIKMTIGMINSIHPFVSRHLYVGERVGKDEWMEIVMESRKYEKNIEFN